MSTEHKQKSKWKKNQNSLIQFIREWVLCKVNETGSKILCQYFFHYRNLILNIKTEKCKKNKKKNNIKERWQNLDVMIS